MRLTWRTIQNQFASLSKQLMTIKSNSQFPTARRKNPGSWLINMVIACNQRVGAARTEMHIATLLSGSRVRRHFEDGFRA